MRVQAHDRGILVPEFVHVLNYDRLRDFMRRVPPPWVFKPRSEAGSMGIKRVQSPDELWRWLETLGDQQSYYVLEQYIPGEVFHVDSIVSEREVVFSIASQYWLPPMDVAHGGGVFCTRTLPYANADAQALLCSAPDRVVDHAARFLGHAEGSREDLLVHILRGLTDQRQLEVVDDPGAVKR
jgi:hypothetical protein